MTTRRKQARTTVVRTVLAYLVSSIVQTIVFFEVGGGHADIPFTMFPDYFVVAPVLPVLVIWNLRLQVWGIDLLSSAAFVVTFVGVWLGTAALLARSRSRIRRSPGSPDPQ